MNVSIVDIIGSVGVVVIIVTYFLLQTERIRSESLAYSALNAAGAAMIAFSLVFDFNFPAFVVEIFWLLISLYGIFKAVSRRS